jgi:hypothetical protein
MQHLHPPGREAKDVPIESFAFDFQLSTVDLPLTTHHPPLTITSNIPFTSRRDGDTLPNWKLGGKQ